MSAFAMFKRTRQPPEKLVTGLFKSVALKPSPFIKIAARELAV